MLALYNETLGEAANAEATKEEMIAAILAAEAEVEDGVIEFGNKDKDKKYPLSKLKIPAGSVVVRHFNTVALANGQAMEDPTTNRFQVYDKVTFDNLSKMPEKDGKQQKSQFQELGLNVDVLHIPE